MHGSWFVRSVAIAAIGLIVLLGGGPARADTTVELNQNPTTAEGFDSHQCGDFGGGPRPDQDIWVFTLENHEVHGDFVSITVTFTKPDATTVTLTIPEAGGDVILGDPDAAWIATPAGWTLAEASAVITGAGGEPQDFFALTHTCPASGSPSPSPGTGMTIQPPIDVAPPTTSASPSIPASPSSPDLTESTVPLPSSSASISPMWPSGAPDAGGGGLITISNVLLGTGALLAAVAGTGFLVLARQRREGA